MQTNKYEVIGVVGEGAYGIVYKCRNKENGEWVAIKKFKETEDEIVKKTMKRELRVLQMLKHENIVEFKEAFKRKANLFLVFEYVDKNLLELLQEQPKGLDPQLIKNLIYQLCKAIKYLHDNNIIHRDIKPENLLVDSNMKLKLCDFGFARTIKTNTKEHLTDYVATRWYRSPELLITNGVYGPEVDYWAIGCIMGELADGNPLFPGENETDQLHCIQRVLGNLTEEQEDMFYQNPLYHGKNLIEVPKPETLERRYMGKLSKVAISFMKGLLHVDPKMRLKGSSVFSHPYFENYGDNKPSASVEYYNLQGSNKKTGGTLTSSGNVNVNAFAIGGKAVENINSNSNSNNNPVAINTTNINIINYNNFENYQQTDENQAQSEKIANKQAIGTKQKIITSNDVQNNQPISNNNFNPNVNSTSSVTTVGGSKKNSENNLPAMGIMNNNLNKIGNLTTRQPFGNTKVSQDSHLFTSINFNKNYKDNLNLISLLPNANLDAAYKTFYKNKEDKYNFEIDFHNYTGLNNNNTAISTNTKPIAALHSNARHKDIIDEEEEIVRDEKKKSKSLNPLVKANTIKKATEAGFLHQDHSPAERYQKIMANNNCIYGINNLSNKNNSPLKGINFNVTSNFLQMGTMASMNSHQLQLNKNNFHLPAIKGGNTNSNLKKFAQLINK